MLAVSAATRDAMIDLAIECYMEEACGLLVGHAATDAVVRFVPCENVTHSGKVYSIAPRDLLRIERDAEADGLEVIGVMHSHTHTEAYPSPTDVAQAPDPAWHYVIVSLKHDDPQVRSFRIVGTEIDEEPVEVTTSD